MKQFIVSDNSIMSGMPCIVGTRIPVARILFLLKEGYSLTAVQQEYPHVALDTFKNVIDELVVTLNTHNYDSQTLQTQTTIG